MSRYILVALLCAVACFMMAPTPTFADDNAAKTPYVPPPNPVTDLYQSMTPNGTSPDMTKEELAALAEKCVAGKPEESSRVMDDGTHLYWTYTWNAKEREDECHVTLTVTLAKDKDEVYKVRGVMYTAQKGEAKPAAPAKDDDPKMNEPENPCHQAFAEVKIGMTADELETLYQKYGLESKQHPIMAHTEKKPDRQGGARWETHWQECGELRPFPGDPPTWMADLEVRLQDEKVVRATYKPMQVRVEEKR